ncbi:hypothetical protein CQ020_16685 [Arthrobacter sp. MYb23]|nr:hypothetical protein CQ038_18100 [Arthrobacter sp. MYb51]PRB93881.1 hypothetical protein CQ020_16685 [Arthrobacter sp. MYb23]
MTLFSSADNTSALFFVLPSKVITGVPQGNPLVGSPALSPGPFLFTWSMHDHFTKPQPGLRQLFCPLLYRARIRPIR